MSDTYENYIADLGDLVTEAARDAIREYHDSINSDSSEFKSGYMMAFHRIVTLMQQQADAFQIPRENIGLAAIDELEFFGGPQGAAQQVIAADN
jgi:hypothetical protein